jgi:phosphatidylserine/phosphatidylglycerophosphate/cardiolipin synthase-like enzyme
MDEISSVFDEIAAESKSLEISTILFYLSPQKRDVLKRFLLRKGELTVSTNNLDTFSTVLGGKKGIMGTTLEKMQEKEFADLSKVGGKVQTYAVNYDDFTFNHAKYVIGDKSVLLTSSNFNYSSDLQAEENGLYIRSEAFANYMRKYNEDVRFKYFKEIDYDHGARLNLLEKSCKFVLKNVF